MMRRRLTIWAMLLGSARLLAAQQAPAPTPPPPNAASLRAEIALLERLLPTLPDSSAAKVLLAADYAALGERDRATALLLQSRFDVSGFDPRHDAPLRALAETAPIRPLIARLEQNFPRVARARQAFVIADSAFFPEGIVYDAARRAVHVGSLYRRAIARVTLDGRIERVVTGSPTALLPILGLRVDPADGALWACSEDERGGSELVHIDTAGRVAARFAPPGAGRHLFNDLVIRSGGEILLTDSEAGKVYRFDRASARFSELPVHRPLLYPNGITLGGDDRTVYVADALGIVRIDLATGHGADVDPGVRSTVAGADGLYWHRGRLVAVQNGLGTRRIAMFHLAADGLRVTRTTVLEAGTTYTRLPTTAAIVGDDLVFMANTNIDNLRDIQIVDPRRLEPVLVGRLRLPS